MADFDIRDIAALKVKLQIIEKLVLADWILIILSMYYDWGGWITCLIVIQIILYIYKSKLRKQLKQKEYLAKVVEERTIELRIQRDQVLNESKKLSDALDALAKAQDELVRKEKLATVGQLTQGLVDRILNPINYINNFAGLSANLIKDLKENITDQQAIMSKENYADSIEILDVFFELLADHVYVHFAEVADVRWSDVAVTVFQQFFHCFDDPDSVAAVFVYLLQVAVDHIENLDAVGRTHDRRDQH